MVYPISLPSLGPRLFCPRKLSCQCSMPQSLPWYCLSWVLVGSFQTDLMKDHHNVPMVKKDSSQVFALQLLVQKSNGSLACQHNTQKKMLSFNTKTNENMKIDWLTLIQASQEMILRGLSEPMTFGRPMKSGASDLMHSRALAQMGEEHSHVSSLRIQNQLKSKWEMLQHSQIFFVNLARAHICKPWTQHLRACYLQLFAVCDGSPHQPLQALQAHDLLITTKPRNSWSINSNSVPAAPRVPHPRSWSRLRWRFPGAAVDQKTTCAGAT